MFVKDKEREDYWKFSKDLYEHGIFSDKTINDIKEDYNFQKTYTNMEYLVIKQLMI